MRVTSRIPVVALLPLVAVLAAKSSMAQSGIERSGYTGYFAAGVSLISNPEMNDGLAANNYPTFSSRPHALNIGAYRLLRSGVMLGGEWHALQLGDGSETHNGEEMGLGAGYATVGIAYAFERSPRVRLYPRLGLGIGGMGLWVGREGDHGRDSIRFEDWLAEPSSDPSYSTLSQGSMVVDVGAGAEFGLRHSGTGPLLGLRLGYIATPFDQGWTSSGRRVSGAPTATVAGPYVRVLFGWRRER
jgi:hypothetical protein